MKKLIALLLAALLLLALCACDNSETPAAESTEPSSQEAPSQNTEEPSEQATEPQPTEPEKTPFELANECIDKTVQELYELIGEPQSADYAPSCLNPGVGEDGNLYYEGFIVYTYREGDKETVSYVEETK